MTCAGGAFGSGGFGTLGAGSGASLAVESAHAVALGAVDVTFTEAPHTTDPFLPSDALNPLSWTLSVENPADATVRFVQSVAKTGNENVIRVYLDGPLTPEATYRITVSELVNDEGGLPIDPACLSATFRGFGASRIRTEVPVSDVRADIANPQIARDRPNQNQPVGTFHVNARGDYALEHGKRYLRKRILRRATTALSGFFHLPDYGFSEPLKSLITPDVMRRIQARAHAQVLREPDVVSASVQVSRSDEKPNLVIVKIHVTQTSGEIEVVTVPIEVSP